MANDGTVKIGISLDESELESGLKKSGENIRKSVQQISKETGKSVDEIKAEVKKIAEEFQKSGDNIPLSYKKAYAQMGIDAKSMRQDVEKEAKKLPDGFKESAKRASDDVKKETEKIPDYFKDSGEKSSKNFGEGLSKLGSVASGAIKVGISALAGVATAATGAVGGLLALESATEEYRIAQGKLNTAFEAAGYGPETASEAYTRFYEILGDTDTATEASQLLAKLAESEEDVATWADIAAGVNGTFGDSLPIEGLIEASNETAKVGQVTGVLADALNWAGISEDEFNSKLAECSDESERNQLIMETLSGTYDEASDAFYRNNKELVEARNAQSQLDSSLAKLGQSVTKVKNKVTADFLPSISKITSGLSDMISGVDGAEKEFSDGISDLIKSASKTVPDFLDIGVDIVEALISGIVKNADELLKAGEEIISSILDAIGKLSPNLMQAGMQIILYIAKSLSENLPQLTQSAVTILTQFVTSILENLPLIAEAALQIIVSLTSGIIDALPTLVDAIPEIIQGILDALDETLPKIIEAGFQLFTALVENLPEIIDSIIGALPKIVSAITDFLLTDAIPLLVDAGFKLFVAIIQNLPEIITHIVGKLPEIVSNIISTFLGMLSDMAQCGFELLVSLVENMPAIISFIVNEIPQIPNAMIDELSKSLLDFVGIGEDMANGIAQGLINSIPFLNSTASSVADKVANAAKSELEINSPSKKFMWIGKMVDEGFAKGIESGSGTIQDSIRKSIPIVSGVTSSMVPRGVFGGQNVTNNTNSSMVFNINVSGASNREEARNIGREIGAEAQREMRRRGLVMA